MLKFVFVVFSFCVGSISYGFCDEGMNSRRDLLLKQLAGRDRGSVTVLEENQGLVAARSFKGSLDFVSVADGGTERRVEFYYNQAKGEGPRPLVFILSPIIGTNPLDRWVALNLARRGISSVTSYYRVHEGGRAKLEHTYRDIVENIQAQMTIVDWVMDRPEVNGDALGLIGISFGGVRASFIMGVDPRIKGAVLVVSGASFADIMTTSTASQAREIRQRQMARNGISTIDAYRRRFMKEQRVFMKDLLCTRDSEDFYLYLDSRDRVVPLKTGERLQQLLPNARTSWSRLGHVGGAAQFGLSKVGAAADFLQDRFFGARYSHTGVSR